MERKRQSSCGDKSLHLCCLDYQHSVSGHLAPSAWFSMRRKRYQSSRHWARSPAGEQRQSRLAAAHTASSSLTDDWYLSHPASSPPLCQSPDELSVSTWQATSMATGGCQCVWWCDEVLAEASIKRNILKEGYVSCYSIWKHVISCLMHLSTDCVEYTLSSQRYWYHQSPVHDKQWPSHPAVSSSSLPAGRPAFRRWQPEESFGEGEAGSFPHASLYPSRLSEPSARHDWSGRHQEADGKIVASPHLIDCCRAGERQDLPSVELVLDLQFYSLGCCLRECSG